MEEIKENKPTETRFRRLIKQQWFNWLVSALISVTVSLSVSSHFSKKSASHLDNVMETATDTLVNQITTATDVSKAEITKTLLKTTEKSKKEITETLKYEITEAVAPDSFTLEIDGKEYLPDSTCIVNTRKPEIKLYGVIKNNSKYPAKDIILKIYLEENAVKEADKTLLQYFAAWFMPPQILQPGSLGVSGFIGRAGVIINPILPNGGGKTICELLLTMTTDKTTVIVFVNKNVFFIIYQLVKGETFLPE